MAGMTYASWPLGKVIVLTVEDWGEVCVQPAGGNSAMT
jgi:hypothetical protein